MTDNHNKFLKHLDASRPAVIRMANYFTKLGYSVRIPPESRAKEAKDQEEHVDAGDLFVEVPVEVKHISYDFTCRDDWPHRDFIVCAKKSFDKFEVKPKAYYIINPAMTHCAIAHSKDCSKWFVKETTDKRYNGKASKQISYMCPLDLLEFKSLG